MPKFQRSINGHLDRYNIVKQCIDLLRDDLLPDHCAPYHVAPKVEELEKVVIGKHFCVKRYRTRAT